MYKLTILLLVLSLMLQGCLVGAFSKAQLLFYSSVSQAEFRTWALSLKRNNIYDTLKAFHKFGYDNMHWVEDSWNGALDYPRDPLIVLKRLRGDCDDYSSLFANGLTEIGIPAIMLSVAYKKDGKDVGHTVCLVKKDDKHYYHISNWTYKYSDGSYKGIWGPYSTIKEVAKSIGGNTVKYYIARDPKNFKVISKVKYNK